MIVVAMIAAVIATLVGLGSVLTLLSRWQDDEPPQPTEAPTDQETWW